jgi:cytidine deaminase
VDNGRASGQSRGRPNVEPVNDDEIDEMIAAAAALARPHEVGGRTCADVGAVLRTPDGRQFGGVCIDTPCGTGFCAEASAIAAMVTAGSYRIASVVAVWGDPRLHVLPPCGRCREFVRQLDPGNIDALVILGRGRAVPLRDLLPAWEWPAPLDA